MDRDVYGSYYMTWLVARRFREDAVHTTYLRWRALRNVVVAVTVTRPFG